MQVPEGLDRDRDDRVDVRRNRGLRQVLHVEPPATLVEHRLALELGVEDERHARSATLVALLEPAEPGIASADEGQDRHAVLPGKTRLGDLLGVTVAERRARHVPVALPVGVLLVALGHEDLDHAVGAGAQSHALEIVPPAVLADRQVELSAERLVRVHAREQLSDRVLILLVVLLPQLTEELHRVEHRPVIHRFLLMGLPNEFCLRKTELMSG